MPVESHFFSKIMLFSILSQNLGLLLAHFIDRPTWRQLHFVNFDQPVFDFSWKVAHGVFWTAQRLVSFGLHVSQHCFCGPVLELLSHLLFPCPLAQSVMRWLQSLIFRYSPLSPVLLLCHVLFRWETGASMNL